MTNDDVIKRLHISRATLFNWFNRDKPPPSTAHQDRLVALFHEPRDYVLEGRMESKLPSKPQSAENQANQGSGDSRAVSPFAEFLNMLRGCREEAERLGAGDPEKTRQIFRQILKTLDQTMSPQVTPEEHDAALRDVLDEERDKRKGA